MKSLKVLNELDVEHVYKGIQSVLEFLCKDQTTSVFGEDSLELRAKNWKDSEGLVLSELQASELFKELSNMFKHAYTENAEEDLFLETLLSHGLSPELSENIGSRWNSLRQTINLHLIQNSARTNSLVDVSWKLSVTIGTDELESCTIPSILVKFSVQEEEGVNVYPLEMNVQQFYSLLESLETIHAKFQQ